LLAPDKRLQDEFGFWFERFLKLHQGQIDATKKSDDLFYSIQQRAFDGELFSCHGSPVDISGQPLQPPNTPC
jgi:hypothetical protein